MKVIVWDIRDFLQWYEGSPWKDYYKKPEIHSLCGKLLLRYLCKREQTSDLYDLDELTFLTMEEIENEISFAASLPSLSPLPLRYGEKGKPYLENGFFFSISHAGDYVGIAFDRERELGFDLERLSRGEKMERISRRFFCEAEIQYLDEFPVEARTKEFVRIWCRKEAYGKALGTGITDEGILYADMMEEKTSCHFTEWRTEEYQITVYLT